MSSFYFFATYDHSKTPCYFPKTFDWWNRSLWGGTYSSEVYESSNRNQWIYKMPNKTRQKLYLGECCMQRSYIVRLKFYSFFLYYSVQTLGPISFLNFSLRDSIPILKYFFQIPETGQTLVSTSLFHPRQTRKGAQCLFF